MIVLVVVLGFLAVLVGGWAVVLARKWLDICGPLRVTWDGPEDCPGLPVTLARIPTRGGLHWRHFPTPAAVPGASGTILVVVAPIPHLWSGSQEMGVLVGLFLREHRRFARRRIAYGGQLMIFGLDLRHRPGPELGTMSA